MTELGDLLRGLDDTNDVREGYVRGVLNYVGAKTESLDNILPHLPYAQSFIEVFGGSGIVTYCRKRSSLEVFNDRNSGITAFYRALQSKETLDRLIELIELMPHSREMFQYCKETYEQDQDTVLRAAKFYYLVQCSFAGRTEYFGRVTKKNGSVWAKIQNNLKYFQPFHERFRQVQIENLDYKLMFKDYDHYNAVFYLDPPYIDSNIYKHKMGKAEHIAMCDRIFGLSGFVALSGFSNPIYDNYDWDEKYCWKIQNNVTTCAKSEGSSMDGITEQIDRYSTREECLWIKEAS